MSLRHSLDYDKKKRGGRKAQTKRARTFGSSSASVCSDTYPLHKLKTHKNNKKQQQQQQKAKPPVASV